MSDLLIQLDRKKQELDTTIKEYREYGIRCAETERAYKVLLRKECLKLRDEGMAIGMIDKTCYGIEVVANARFERDIAQAEYKASQELINSIKLQLRILEGQIQREWNS